VPNHVDAIDPCVGRGVRNPNLEFGVVLVKEEDWTCGLIDRHRGNRGALMDRRLRVLKGVPKDEVTAAIVWREVKSWIVKLDLRVVHYIPDEVWRQRWHHWLLIAFSIMKLLNET
jgi:hypothetical protein